MKYKIKCFLKYFATIVLINILKVLWILPIDNDKILFFSFDGKQFSDNPKYIYINIKKNYPNKKIIWAFRNINNYKDLMNEVKLVKIDSLRFLFEIITSKVIITNDYISSFIPIRKSQILLNTWHGGSPLKTVGFAVSNPDYYNHYFFKIHNKKYSAFLSSSNFMTQEVFKKSFNYRGNILEYGMPRNAIFFEDTKDLKNKVYKYFNIDDNNIGLVLYAPTFRGNSSNPKFLPNNQMIDIEMCKKALKNKFGKDFLFLFRAHHSMKNIMDNNVIIASDYPDMQELLCAVDVLITDYSSCMGDMALTRKPVFLYTPDLEEYIKDRGFYWDIYSLPFPIAKNNNEMEKNILDYNQNAYNNEIKKYFDSLVSFENIDSTNKTVKWLSEHW